MNQWKIDGQNKILIQENDDVLIDLYALNNTFKLDIRYATTNNFTGKVMYSQPRAFLQKEAAMALNEAQDLFGDLGLGLIIYDAYRPLSVQKEMWKIKPDRRYVADPRKGSNHNRGMAVDVGLYELESGAYLEMPTEFDSFNKKAWANSTAGISAIALYNRAILKQIMKRCGFKMNSTEWWHFDYKNCSKYPVLDISFESIQIE
jgi:D-alanyl-D-alanine dipeptidase